MCTYCNFPLRQNPCFIARGGVVGTLKARSDWRALGMVSALIFIFTSDTGIKNGYSTNLRMGRTHLT